MADVNRPLQHQDAEQKDDDVLRQEADAHLAKTPALQLIAELLIKLRASGFSWWTPDRLRTRWPAKERMSWLSQRGDVRQHMTTMLTGLAPRSARRKDPEFQAGLIDSAVDEGDVSAIEFEEAFDPVVVATYGPAAEFWRQFREWMPWDQDAPAQQQLIAWLLDALVTDKSSVRGLARKPIITHWDARTAISNDVWHTRIPLEIRVAIDDARFKRERTQPSEPFRAVDDWGIALPEIIAANVMLRDLRGVLDVAERAMGFGASEAKPQPQQRLPVGTEARTKAPVDPAPAVVETPTRPTNEETTPNAVMPSEPKPKMPEGPVSPLRGQTARTNIPVPGGPAPMGRPPVPTTQKHVAPGLKARGTQPNPPVPNEPVAKPVSLEEASVDVPVDIDPEVDSSATARISR